MLNVLLGTDAVQHVVVQGATGGTYTLSFASWTTAAIQYNATAAALQSALATAAGDPYAFLVSQDPAPPGGATAYFVTFTGALGGQPQALVGANGASLTPAGAAVSVSSIVAGFHPAAGDGTTDDTLAIQTLLNAGGNMTLYPKGVEIYFPAGTFFISDTLYPYSGQTLLGEGYSSTIQFTATTSFTDAISNKSNIPLNNVRITSLRLLNAAASQLGRAVDITSTSPQSQNVTVDSVEGENCLIALGYGGGHLVRDCYVHDLGFPVAAGTFYAAISIGDPNTGAGLPEASDFRIEGNLVTTIRQMGILANGIGGVIQNNVVDHAGSDSTSGAGYWAIAAWYSQNVTVTGNVITNCPWGIVSFEATAGAAAIVNNVLDNSSVSFGNGIQVYQPTVGPGRLAQVLVADNAVSGFLWGIWVANEAVALISGNVLKNFGAGGIYASMIGTDQTTAFTDLQVTRNVVVGQATQPAGLPAIFASTPNALIQGNLLDGQNGPQAIGIDGPPLAPSWIVDNVVRGSTSAITPPGSGVVVERNQGYVTENTGMATLAPGASSVQVTHGLSVTPAQVQVTFSSPPPGPSSLYVDQTSIGPMFFMISISPAVSGPNSVTVDWYASG